MDQGSNLSYVFTLLEVGGGAYALTSYDARLQVRASYGATSTLINCTVANSKLVIASNTITLVLVPADTSSIRFADKDDETLDCVYDLEIIAPSGSVYKPARGSFTLTREVTR